jgi:nuclear GTP-binding protein
MASEPTLSSLAQLAESASANDISSAPSDSTSAAANKTKEQQRRYDIRMLHKVVDEADVVLLVLDARDPAGCRSRLVGKRYAGAKPEGKASRFCCSTKSVRKPHSFSSSSSSGIIDIRPYYRNVDLVPRENAQAWLKHLRHTTPTLPFRSAGPHQREPGIWHGPGIAPPPQGVQTERGAERHRRRRWLPQPTSAKAV